ncbi:hypothetical protein V9L05_08715 [Bernardetia sp. Wsw4-3y2]|uniref:hypothetical protein n=1 Tax=Bernardetia sp. Wsw4-3y2 TaxID=3127471 RepID=UPI0030CE770E
MKKPKKLFTLFIRIRQVVKAIRFIQSKFRKKQKFAIMQDNENLGTVQLVAFFGNVGTFANTVGTALEDKKVSVQEGFTIAFGLMPFLQTNISQTFEELKDLHENEVQEVSNAFAKRFDISNEKAEAFIELCVNAILANTAIFVAGKDILGR